MPVPTLLAPSFSADSAFPTINHQCHIPMTPAYSSHVFPTLTANIAIIVNTLFLAKQHQPSSSSFSRLKAMLAVTSTARL